MYLFSVTSCDAPLWTLL